MKISLDTNAYSRLMSGDPQVRAWVQGANHVFLSAIVLGELLGGFRNGQRLDENLRVLNEFLRHPRVHEAPITRATADRYARLWVEMRSRGRPIPANDLWIAAHALETGSDLVTYDQHFAEISGLIVLPEV